jgi:hypothetical protein
MIFVEPRPCVAVPLPDVDEGVQGNDYSFWPDVDVDPLSSAANIDTSVEGAPDVVDEVDTNTALLFKEEYGKNIQPTMAKVQSLCARAMWSGRPIATHPPASNVDMDKLLDVLRRISPLNGDTLQIDSSSINKHHEIHEVLNNSSRGSTYFRQLF